MLSRHCRRLLRHMQSLTYCRSLISALTQLSSVQAGQPRRQTCALRKASKHEIPTQQQAVIDRRQGLVLLGLLPSLSRLQSATAQEQQGRQLAPEEQAAVKAALQKIATKAKVRPYQLALGIRMLDYTAAALRWSQTVAPFQCVACTTDQLRLPRYRPACLLSISVH